MLKRVNLWHVKRTIREQGQWKGYIVSDNVNPFHVAGGWHIGAYVTAHSIDELRYMECSYLYYNREPSLWRHLGQFHYYQEVNPS